MPLTYTPTVRDLLDIYMSANTPAYLYKRLRLHHHVQALAERNTPAMLAAQVHELPSPEQRKGEDVVLAYACLAALTIHGDHLAAEELRGLDVSALTWGAYFVEAAEPRLTASQRLCIDAAPRPLLLESPTRSALPREAVARDATPRLVIEPPRTPIGSKPP